MLGMRYVLIKPKRVYEGGWYENCFTKKCLDRVFYVIPRGVTCTVGDLINL